MPSLRSLFIFIALPAASVAHAQIAHADAAETSSPPAAVAAPTNSEPTLTWILTPSLVSQYMLRGIRLGGAAFQPSLEGDYGNLALGVWASTPIADKVPGQSDPEIDPYGSYTFTVNDSLNVQPGFICYLYPRAVPANGFFRATFEPSLCANWTVQGVTFTPKIYYDVVLEGVTSELSAVYTIPLKKLGTEFDLTAAAGTQKIWNAVAQSSPRYRAWGDYWIAGFWLPFKTGKDSKLKLGWAYTSGRDAFLKQGNAPKEPNSGAVGRGVAAVSWTCSR